MSTAESHLRCTVAHALPALAAISDAAASIPRTPGKWSRKEIVGHLIDSASNNHERFVRAQFTDDLICPTYDQDAWVLVQRYRDAPWGELVALWSHFNVQLARVIEATSPEIRARPRVRHNLEQVAFVPPPEGEPATLEYFMRDYVVHLEHHLAQILS
jgi:hypothetical protein